MAIIYRVRHCLFKTLAPFPLRCMILIIMLMGISIRAQTQELYINELLSSNSSTNLDPDFYSFCDWIEIYNSEETAVDISGYYITDDLTNPLKFQFPNYSIIQPKGYFIVWADGKNYHPGTYHIYPEDIDLIISDCHTNFKLKKSAEEIGLFSPNGDLIDSITFNKQITNVSYGRNPDATAEWIYFCLLYTSDAADE